jgi:hypothetical protein
MREAAAAMRESGAGMRKPGSRNEGTRPQK